MFQGNFKGVSSKFQGGFKAVTRKFQGCLIVSEVFQEIFLIFEVG